MHPTDGVTSGAAMDGLVPDKGSPDSAERGAVESGSPGADHAILIVEPNFKSQTAIKAQLARFGLQNLVVTGRGYRAIEIGARRKFAAILIANPLLQIEGVDVIQVLREKGMNADTPIIFIGESENDFIIQKAFRYGATGSLHKPIAPDTLRTALEGALGVRLTTPEEEIKRVQTSMEPMRRAVEYAKKLRSEGDFEIAEEEFKKGLVEIFCGLAEVYLSKGDAVAAEAALAEAEQIEPDAREKFAIREERFVEQGQVCLRKKAFIGAKAEFSAALSLNEESTSALMGMGEAHSGLDEELEAHQTFERLMKTSEGVGPKDPRILKKMALIACQNRQFDLAWLALDRALDLYPNDASLFYLKAVAYIAEGRVENTLPLLEKALLLNPDLTEARVLAEKARSLIQAKRAQAKSKPNKKEDDIYEDFLFH